MYPTQSSFVSRFLGSILLIALSLTAAAARAQTPAPVRSDAAAPTPAATPSFSGFSLTSGGDPPPWTVRFKLTLQADGRAYLDDPTKDNFLIRRARPILEGTLFDLIDFRLMPDVAGSQVVLFDASADIHPWPWLRLRVGKYKPPVGLERTQDDADLPFIERAITSDLSPVRDVGARIAGDIDGGVFHYVLGVFDGAPDGANIDQDNGKHKDLAGRIVVQPFKHDEAKLGALGLVFAASTGVREGKPKDVQLTALRTVGQQTFFSYLAPASDTTGDATVYAKGRHTGLNPGLYYYRGAFGLLGEAIWSKQRVRTATALARLTHFAWHATASYVIGGKNGYTGPTPASEWNPKQGKLGAFELAARFQWLDVDRDAFPIFADANASARSVRGLGLGANWILTRQARLMVSYEHSWFEGGAKAGADRKPEDALLSRVQLNF